MSKLKELLEFEVDSMTITDVLVQYEDVDYKEYIMTEVEKDGHPALKIVINFDNNMKTQYEELYNDIVHVTDGDVMYENGYSYNGRDNKIVIIMLSCVPEYQWLKEIQSKSN